MSCIVEDATKTILKLSKLKHQTRNRFQTNLCLDNCFFVQKLLENFFLKQNIPTECLYVKKCKNKVPEKQTNSIQMSYIVEDAKKSFSKLRKLEH